MNTKFLFEIGQRVRLVESDEVGTVTGRAEYEAMEPCYFVRYKAGDGRQVSCWWGQSSIRADQHDDNVAVDCAREAIDCSIDGPARFLRSEVDALCQKAAAEPDSATALAYSQAAVNVASAIRDLNFEPS